MLDIITSGWKYKRVILREVEIRQMRMKNPLITFRKVCSCNISSFMFTDYKTFTYLENSGSKDTSREE
jgi:hypothetical protein